MNVGYCHQENTLIMKAQATEGWLISPSEG